MKSKETEEPFTKVYLYRRIVQSKLFIDEHFAENIDVGAISSEACFSRYHFIRTFKKIYGRTPHQYLTSVRLQRAKALLEQDLPVIQVCLAVGFNSTTSFAGLFKRAVGVPPSRYQSSRRERKAAVAGMPVRFIPGCYAERIACLEKSNFQEASR